MASSVLGISDDAANIVGSAKAVGRSAESEEFVFILDGDAATPNILRRLVGGIQEPECELSSGAGQLRSPRRVDNPARVDGVPHVAIAAGAGNVK